MRITALLTSLLSLVFVPTTIAMSPAPVSVTVTVEDMNMNPAGTPSWIGTYRNAMQTAPTKAATVTDAIASCPEAEGNPGKLLSLQMVGACPVKKVSTRYRRW